MITNNLAVIMSVYRNDCVEYTAKAIESVLNQTFSHFDFYIQCDGPINEELDKYLECIADKRVTIRHRAENRGLAYSLNELLEVVMPLGYEYIARMDADDINAPRRFERQMAYFDAHPNIECLGTWAVEINSRGEEYYHKQMPETHTACYQLFRKRDCMIHPTVIFRRAYIEKAGLYALDTYFGEDTMMWAQGFAANCVLGNVPEYLYQFRLDDHFFDRRRGWKHAKNIYLLRHRVNKMLHYGISADLWAIAYACAKMMPTSILNILYKKARK